MAILNEIWKDIPGYEGYYQASDQGRIRSLDRYVKHPGGGLVKVPGMIKTLTMRQNGYLKARVSKDGKGVNIEVHTLVMLAFHGKSSLLIDHRNGDKTNNRPSNLRYCTPRDNGTCDNINRSNATGYQGVSMCPANKNRPYVTTIRIDGVRYRVGSFGIAQDASACYQKLLSLLKDRAVGHDNSDVIGMIKEHRANAKQRHLPITFN